MLHRSRKLSDNLFAYIWSGQGNNAHTYLFPNVLSGERPHVIVDPGLLVDEMYEGCFDSLTDAMGHDGFNMEDIGLIINTHTHPDHCQATETIVDKSTRTNGKGKINKAVVAITKEADDYYRVAGERMFNMFGMKVVKLDPHPGAFARLHLPLLAGQEGPDNRRPGVQRQRRPNGLPRRQHHHAEAEHREGLAIGRRVSPPRPLHRDGQHSRR
jgi:glyoxylase-like metal-dependent hydrolase (beta-lactamase superfamily II)